MSTQYLENDGRCFYDRKPFAKTHHDPPVARFVLSGGFLHMTLCKHCLDRVLDHCDERPELEPAALEWITHPPVHHWCVRHNWPYQLCHGWLHGPKSNAFGQLIVNGRVYQ